MRLSTRLISLCAGLMISHASLAGEKWMNV